MDNNVLLSAVAAAAAVVTRNEEEKVGICVMRFNEGNANGGMNVNSITILILREVWAKKGNMTMMIRMQMQTDTYPPYYNSCTAI